MTQKTKMVLMVGFLISLTGCGGCTRVSPGYVGVKSTLVGSERGMIDVAVGPAWVYYNPMTASILEYPTFVQTVVWTHAVNEGHPTNEEITFTTKDSMQVAADISLAYALEPSKVPAFYMKFRSDDLDTFTHGFLRNLAREKFDNAAGKYSIEQVMGDNAQFLHETRQALQEDLASVGVKLEQFGFIGAPRPPQVVIDSINSKVQATQLAIQKQNELQQSEADAKKRIAAADGEAQSILKVAEAQAQANLKLANSITPTLIEYRKLEKWDGKLPQVQSGGGGIILGIGSDKK